MVSAIFFALTFLDLIHSPQKVSNELDAATNERMQQRAAELQARMTQLLLEMEQRDQEHSWAHAGDLLLSMLQNWHFWALTAELVMFFVLCHMLMKLRRELGSRKNKGISGSKGDDDIEEDSTDILDARRFVSGHMQWPVMNPEETCKLVEEVVDKLLCVYQTIPRNKFMPQLQPPIGVSNTFGPTENDTTHVDHELKALYPIKTGKTNPVLQMKNLGMKERLNHSLNVT